MTLTLTLSLTSCMIFFLTLPPFLSPAMDMYVDLWTALTFYIISFIFSFSNSDSHLLYTIISSLLSATKQTNTDSISVLGSGLVSVAYLTQGKLMQAHRQLLSCELEKRTYDFTPEVLTQLFLPLYFCSSLFFGLLFSMNNFSLYFIFRQRDSRYWSRVCAYWSTQCLYGK